MNSAQIENNLKKLMKSLAKETFIYELLLAYGLPKASITRLQKGNLDLAKEEGTVSWKKKVLFREEFKKDLHLSISELADQVTHNQRFVVVTDYKTLLAIDTEAKETLDIQLEELPKHYDFFLPWAGMEKAQHANENPADVKAAERMAKLFDEIKKDNPDDSHDFIHDLNVFLSRLLFCFFAEDTKIFKDGQFTNAVSSHTQADGSDLNSYLDKLFEILNTPKEDRGNIPLYLNEFPYVNGGLFRKKINAPKFTKRSRQAIIDSGELDWAAINPDIFGSMIQAVISPEQRGGLGMHYTSVPNIMKVIEPLFLNDLYEAFEKTKGSPKKLHELLFRMSKIKIFDPACGSGNFLIIAYKELRRLEIKIIHHLQELQKVASGFNPKTEQLSLIPKSQLSLAASFQVDLFSRIQLSQFYGIELDDFAHEVAKLSLWLAEHQMNLEFLDEFGQTRSTLPLKEAGNIVHGNACRIDWESICPKEKEEEVYILGNPPYTGYARQNETQKADMAVVFRGIKDYKKLDFISCWFYIGIKYINYSASKLAFVTTNSITQGEQVSLLWPQIYNNGLEIGFAYQSFKWKNNARANAGVSVAIIGIQAESNRLKTLYLNEGVIEVNNINPYLIPVGKSIVHTRQEPVSKLPKMIKGCSPGDNGNLLLTDSEKESLLISQPAARQFLKKYVGAREFMYNDFRYCIWVDEGKTDEAYEIPEFVKRFQKVRQFRLSSKKKATQDKAETPHLFDERKYKPSNSILVPQTGSERRKYLPIGFLGPEFVISNAARVIYDAEPWLFGVLSSRMHIVWVKAVAGRLKMDMQYSNTLCYNTFPFPPVSVQRKQEIQQSAFRVLEERERFSEKTLAQLYDPDGMPEGLREAHLQNDLAIERCYRARPFKSDEERLEFLFKLYEKMIAEESAAKGAGEKQQAKKEKQHA